MGLKPQLSTTAEADIRVVDPCTRTALTKHPPLDGRSGTSSISGVTGIHCNGGTAISGLSYGGIGVSAFSLGGGRAVFASSESGEAVFGVSETGEGVHGETAAATLSAVVGISKATMASDRGLTAGLFGKSMVGEGVHGESSSPTFAAVVGLQSSSGAGGFFRSESGVGVHGETSSLNLAAVAGWQLNGDSTAPAIFGRHEGPGPAGYFDGNVVVTKDIFLANGDCAEDFDVAAEASAEPGTVMVLDECGGVLPSFERYDRRVAGVVSGAGPLRPAIILNRKGSGVPGRVPLALMGKVYCKVDAGSSPIAVGDLLTSSGTLGHAMKADDPERAFGAVIGKALAPLARGTGLIPVLVGLR